MTAEFYRRTGHPGSAYFYYEIVRRRYPNTPYADEAIKQMQNLRAVNKAGSLPRMPTDEGYPRPHPTASLCPIKWRRLAQVCTTGTFL